MFRATLKGTSRSTGGAARRRPRLALLAVLACAAVAAGCASRTRLIKNENAIIVEGLFSMWGSWIKDKGHKLDVRFHVANDAPHAIVIRTRDIHCSRGDRWGELRLLRVPSRAAGLHLYPGQTISLTAVCELPVEGYGDFRVLVSHVFEARGEPRRRRRPPPLGELVATDIEWIVPAEQIR